MYDCCIIGGGLAGLSSAILLAEEGFSVALFEKKKYPFHKVCGEYISMESYPFIKELGIPLEELDLPRINHLKISSPKGYYLEQEITPGGFGISRYKLDNLLFQHAKKLGVAVFDSESVTHIQKLPESSYLIKSVAREVESKICIGSFGKRSNLDKDLDRRHKKREKLSSKNYIGIKYHVKADIPAGNIELHNFKDGYCGISKIEEDRFCLCYLTTAQNLKDSGGDINVMEREILSKNPFLNRYLKEFPGFYDNPLIISNIYFKQKGLIENDILMSGDAAGLITPLCGNGMSMALHASAMVAGLTSAYLKNIITKDEVNRLYTTYWNKAFKTRLKAGRIFQNLFGHPGTTDFVISLLGKSSALTQKLVNLTNGKTFTKDLYYTNRLS